MKTHRRTALVVVASLAGVLAVAACSSETSDRAAQSANGSAPQTGSVPRPDAEQAAPATGALDSAYAAKPQGNAPVKVAAADRAIIRNGEVSVKIAADKEVAKAAEDATRIATDAGGYIGADNRRNTDGRSIADLQLRVPGEKFDETVRQLADLGEVSRRKISVENVTEAVVDVDARIQSQQASVDRVRALLARADKIADLASVERELASREGELASLQATRRSLAAKTDYSTITLHLAGPGSTPKPKEEPGFLSALGDGWDALGRSFTVLLVIVGTALPFLLVLGLPLLAAGWLVRRRRATAAAGA